MINEKLLRRVIILCQHCLRNLAFYRAGWSKGDLLFKDKQFWVNLNSNFLDVCVLEWCKLFADKKGVHYWEKIIIDQKKFYNELLSELNISDKEFNEYIQSTRNYRDKFIAHLDKENFLNIPNLDNIKESVSYLHDYIMEKEGFPIDCDSTSFYEKFYKEGQFEYNNLLLIKN